MSDYYDTAEFQAAEQHCYDVYAPPSQFTNTIEEARECIKWGDFWVFDYVGETPDGSVLSYARGANESDWNKMKAFKNNTSDSFADTGTLISVLLIVFLGLIGVLIMFFWS